MIVESVILKLFQTAFGNFTDLPVKYVNTNIKIPSNGKWWEIFYIPNNVEDEFWGEGKTYQGIFRPMLHWGQDNKGIYKPLSEVDKIVKGFPKGLKLVDNVDNVTVVIVDNPDVNNIIEESPELLIPLTIRYTCFKV